jgi:hypothetical protein
MATLRDQINEATTIPIATPGGSIRIPREQVTPELRERLNAGDFAGAEALINQTPAPQSVSPMQRDLTFPPMEMPAPATPAPLRAGRLQEPATQQLLASAQAPMPAPMAPQMMPPPMAAPVPQMAPAQPQGYGVGGLEDALLRSSQLQIQAGQGLAQAQRQAAQAEQQALTEQQTALTNYYTELENSKKDYDTKVKPALEKLDTMGQEIQGAEYKSFWAKASTPQRIGAGLAIALGAIGSALAKTPNYALDIVNKAIDDDFRTWQANVDSKNKSFLNQRQYINDLQSEFKDRQQMALAQKVLAYDKVNAQLLQIAAKRKEVEALPAFQQLQANILDNRNKQYLELAKLRAETAKAEREAAPVAPGSGVVQALQTVPKEFQSEAYKELKSVTEYNKVQEDVVNAFQDAENISLSAAVPGFLGGNSEAYDAWVAKIAGAIVGKVPGIKSDQDFRAIVKPMLPTWTDTNRVAELKKQNMIGFLRSQSPSAPILNSFGYNLAPNFNQQPSQPTKRAAPGEQPQRITSGLREQAKLQLDAAQRALRIDPTNEQARRVMQRAQEILGQ